MEVIRKDPGRPVLKQNRENGIEYLTFPGLEACGAAQHMVSTRIGGVSEGIYASMNLSFTRGDDPLAVRETVTLRELLQLPLICSRISIRQSGVRNAYAEWFGKSFEKLNIVATYNLVFNASLLVEEGLGYAVCFDKLINVSGDSKLCFRPLSPKMEAEASIIWKRYQLLSKAAQKFMDCLKESCEFHGV